MRDDTQYSDTFMQTIVLYKHITIDLQYNTIKNNEMQYNTIQIAIHKFVRVMDKCKC